MKIGSWDNFDRWNWQRKEDELHGDEPKRGIFASPRLGKTLCVTGTAFRRGKQGLWQRGLVTAPLKVCPIWERDMRGANIPVHLLYDMTHKEIAAYFTGNKKRQSWEGLAIVNRDKLIDVWEILGHLNLLDMFIADESHNYAAVSSRRARAYRAFAREVPFVRALTGTPVPKHYGSLWGQLSPFDMDRWDPIELRDEHSRIGAYKRFEKKFLVTNPMFASQVISHINVPALQRMVLDVASVYRREDIWGKDKYQPVQRDVDMPAKAWELYRRMARESLLAEYDLEASNAGVKLLRLQQITSGIIPTGEENSESVTIHTAKIDMLVEDLADIFVSGEKSVIFHRFRPEGRQVVERLARDFKHVPVWTVNGTERVSAAEHYRRTEAFNDYDGPAAIVVQIQSGSEGISLRKGNHLAYLSRTMSFTDDEQSRDRAYEPGELRTISYYNVPGTVDDFVTELLASRRTLHEAVKNMDRESMAYGPIRGRRKT